MLSSPKSFGIDDKSLLGRRSLGEAFGNTKKDGFRGEEKELFFHSFFSSVAHGNGINATSVEEGEGEKNLIFKSTLFVECLYMVAGGIDHVSSFRMCVRLLVCVCSVVIASIIVIIIFKVNKSFLLLS